MEYDHKLWWKLLLFGKKQWKNLEGSYGKLIAWKVSKYGVFSGLYFPVFGLNTGKYGPENTPYLDTFKHYSFFEKVLPFFKQHPPFSAVP